MGIIKNPHSIEIERRQFLESNTSVKISRHLNWNGASGIYCHRKKAAIQNHCNVLEKICTRLSVFIFG